LNVELAFKICWELGHLFVVGTYVNLFLENKSVLYDYGKLSCQIPTCLEKKEIFIAQEQGAK
jgi:hypothetical protein